MGKPLLNLSISFFRDIVFTIVLGEGINQFGINWLLDYKDAQNIGEAKVNSEDKSEHFVLRVDVLEVAKIVQA